MKRILLVEDNETNCDMLLRRLKRLGYEVAGADNGVSGIAAALSHTPDVILMDLSLPEMDGWEAARRLKASELTREIPIIALTAYASESDRARAIEAGCDDYETKPLDLEQLLRKIRALTSEAVE
jgi:two-component system, cell cycle response regulator DivK